MNNHNLSTHKTNVPTWLRIMMACMDFLLVIVCICMFLLLLNYNQILKYSFKKYIDKIDNLTEKFYYISEYMREHENLHQIIQVYKETKKPEMINKFGYNFSIIKSVWETETLFYIKDDKNVEYLLRLIEKPKKEFFWLCELYNDLNHPNLAKIDMIYKSSDNLPVTKNRFLIKTEFLPVSLRDMLKNPGHINIQKLINDVRAGLKHLHSYNAYYGDVDINSIRATYNENNEVTFKLTDIDQIFPKNLVKGYKKNFKYNVFNYKSIII